MCYKNERQVQSDIDEIESTQDLWQAGYHWAVTGRVIVELKERGSYKFVVSWDGEQGLLRQPDNVETLVLLWPRAVGGDVWVLGSLEVGSPPVGHHILN